MKIHITDNHTTGQIKDIFSKRYPLLKLEFFTSPETIDASHRIQDENVLISKVRKQHTSGDLEIHPEDKVSDVEKKFLDGFGLVVQVLRRSGNIWLVTQKTDQLTLQQQNEIAADMLVSPDREEPEDYHEQP